MANSLVQSGIVTVRLSNKANRAWTDALHNHQLGFQERGPFEGFITEAIARADQALSPPEVAESLEALATFKINAVIIENLPVDDTLPPPPTDGRRPPEKGCMSESMLLALMSACGEPFGYLQEKEGRLVHEVAPVPGAEKTQSNEGRDAFAGHIDNSFLNYPFRPTFLALLGLVNEERTPTLIYEVEQILASLDPRDVMELYGRNFRIRSPKSFKFRNPIWVDERSLIEDVDGQFAAGFNHRFNVQPTNPAAERAYVAVCRAIDGHEPAEVVIEPGTALIFNNCRVLHARRAIEGGSRWLQRVYGTANLDAMQTSAGFDGRIFDARHFL